MPDTHIPTPATPTARELGERYADEIIALRRHFHQHPELSAQEHETSAYIRERLDELDIPYELVEGPRPVDAREERDEFIGTGIIATIRGQAPDAYDADGKPAMRVALRSDMDALPVAEKTGLPFASQNDGIMHACGHDCHMAMLLGAAHILADMRDQLRGEVRLIFQPAEEISIGARDMIAAGALDGVDAIFGQHVWSEVDAGTFSCEPGGRMGNTDWFRIDIEGVSAHGSMPHKGVDAIVVACEIVNALQLLVSRRSSPFEPVVVTVGEIHGGTARNIMAGSAYITGTVRTWNNEMREFIAHRLERICGRLVEGLGAKIKIEYTRGNPAVINDKKVTTVAADGVADNFGDDALAHYQGTLSGEDFAEYLQHVPGVFVFTGIRNPQAGTTHPQHSCYYDVDESVLAPGAVAAAQWALDMLQ